MARELKKPEHKAKRVLLTLDPQAVEILNKEKNNKSRFVSRLIVLFGNKLLNG